MANLVIVESPAKCGKISGFLGPGWKVIASLGHIRQLKEDLDAVGIERDFEAAWEFSKEKAKAIGQIKEAAKNATKVYLAADDDREGELIAYSVCLLLKLDPATAARAVFHEITETAVKAAVASPRTLDMNKVNAAQARAVLDMMVGFTISPLLWKNVAPALSAGRCQTPALRLCVDREAAIAEFKCASSWKIHGTWAALGSRTSWPAHLTDELEDQDSAETYLEIHHKEKGGEVLAADTRPWSEAPPVPLITSTFQQQASALFRVNPKDAMKIAQRLYEAGHITYMRTDKAVLSEEARKAAEDFVTKHAGGATYVGSSGPSGGGGQEAPKKTKKTTKKEITNATTEGPKAQEAHEAIRPTHINLVMLPCEEDWTVRDRKLYELIWRRTIQSVMAPARGDQRSVTFVADGDDKDDFKWRATWRKTTFQGWRKLNTGETAIDTESKDENTIDSALEAWEAAEKLEPGTKLEWSLLQADPHETKAPQRFTEATLIQQLEGNGIGRPSTFANLISAIQDKKYVETKSFEARTIDRTVLKLTKRDQWPPEKTTTPQKVGGEKDRLTPTPLGKSVLDFCVQHFDDLFTYGFTSQMESRLDNIATGGEQWKQVLRDTWAAYKDRYETLKQTKATLTESSARRRDFGNGLAAVMSKKGPLLLREDPAGDKEKTVFYGWPTAAGQGFLDLTPEDAAAFAEAAGKERTGISLGTHEGLPVLRKSGKFGTYAEWNGKTTSCLPTDDLGTIVAKFQTASTAVLRTVGQFEIRTGAYGPYMFKKDSVGPARKFVSIPEHMNIDEVNEAQLIAIFQHGLQNKARSGAYGSARGGSARGARGGGTGQRGRGGGRGRGK
jgi:DNA topoisomerase-1